MAGSSNLGFLLKAAIVVSVETGLSWRLDWGRVWIPAHVVVGRIQFLGAVGIRASVLSWQLAGHPQFLAMLASLTCKITSSFFK